MRLLCHTRLSRGRRPDMNKKITSLLLVLALLISTLSLFTACSANEYAPAMWLLEGEGGAKIYFLGSIHIGDESMYPLPDYIESAYEQCQYLAVECDIIEYERAAEAGGEEFAAAELLTYMYKDGTSASDHLSKETYDACVEYFTDSGFLAANGMSMADMDKLHISLWQQILSQQIIDASGYDTEYGIDRHFLNAAKQSGKRILEIESVEFQTSLSFDIPDSVYDDTILSMLTAETDAQVLQYEYMLDIYKRGRDDLMATQNELTALLSFGSPDPDYETYDRVMLTDRNKGMAQRAEEYLNEGYSVFYVVGAAHMCGESGVIQLLINEGYDVKRVG